MAAATPTTVKKTRVKTNKKPSASSTTTSNSAGCTTVVTQTQVTRKKTASTVSRLTSSEFVRIIDILKGIESAIPQALTSTDRDSNRALLIQSIRLADFVANSRLSKKAELVNQIRDFSRLLGTVELTILIKSIQLQFIIDQFFLRVQSLILSVELANLLIDQVNVLSRLINVVDDFRSSPGDTAATPVYANVFDNANQTVSNNQPVRFNQFNQAGSIVAEGITATSTTLTVAISGDYAVDWNVSFLPPRNHCVFGIFVNGTLAPSSVSGLAVSPGQQINAVGGAAIVRLAANDRIDLRAIIPPSSTQQSIQLSSFIAYAPFEGAADQPIASATLRIMKLD